jgi:hypothetical protein
MFTHEPQPGPLHADLARVVHGHKAIAGLIAEHAAQRARRLAELREEAARAGLDRGPAGAGRTGPADAAAV